MCGCLSVPRNDQSTLADDFIPDGRNRNTLEVAYPDQGSVSGHFTCVIDNYRYYLLQKINSWKYRKHFFTHI